MTGLGLSAQAIAGYGIDHPWDPADLLRCVNFCRTQGIDTTALLLVTFVGAANADATPEQADELLSTVLPIMQDESLTLAQAASSAIDATARIMGPEWEPKGEWDDWMLQLLESAREAMA